MCSACGGDYEDPDLTAFDDMISEEQQEIATDTLLMAIRNKGRQIDDGRALVKQFLDHCKETNSVMEALRRSMNEG